MIKMAEVKIADEKTRRSLVSLIDATIAKGDFINGYPVTQLEQSLARYVGSGCAVGCASGTDALTIALKSLDLPRDSVVFLPAFTFAGTLEAVIAADLVPRFVDIEYYTFNMDYSSLQREFTKVVSDTNYSPKVILPVDMFGVPCPYDNIITFAEENNLHIVEDAAQAIGANYLGIKQGDEDFLACTSFYPTKPLGCFGDGGMIFANDYKAADKIRSICNHGFHKDKYHHKYVGTTSRLDTLQAVVLLSKLQKLEAEINSRMLVACNYNRFFNPEIRIKNPLNHTLTTSSWAQYSILLENEDQREKIRGKLNIKMIESEIFYPIPLHMQEAYAYLGYKEEDFPFSEAVSRRIVSLPIHPGVTMDNVRRVATTIIENL